MDVGAHEGHGVVDAPVHVALRREVDDRIAPLNRLFYGVPEAYIAFDEPVAGVSFEVPQVVLVARIRQLVEVHHADAGLCLHQVADEVAANEARATRDQDLPHVLDSPSLSTQKESQAVGAAGFSSFFFVRPPSQSEGGAPAFLPEEPSSFLVKLTARMPACSLNSNSACTGPEKRMEHFSFTSTSSVRMCVISLTGSASTAAAGFCLETTMHWVKRRLHKARMLFKYFSSGPWTITTPSSKSIPLITPSTWMCFRLAPSTNAMPPQTVLPFPRASYQLLQQ